MRSQHYHKNPKYKLRKLSIGVVSFLSGFSFVIAGGSIASAEEIDPSHASTKIESEATPTEEAIVPEKKIATAEEAIVPEKKPATAEEAIVPEKKPATAEEAIVPEKKPATAEEGSIQPSPQVQENTVSGLNSQTGTTTFRMAAAPAEDQVRYARTVKVTLPNKLGYTGESLTIIVKSGATKETFTIPKTSSNNNESTYSGTINALIDISSSNDVGKLGNNIQFVIGDAPVPIGANNTLRFTRNGIDANFRRQAVNDEPNWIFTNDSEIFSKNYDLFSVKLTNRYWQSTQANVAELKYEALPGFEHVIVPENKLIVAGRDYDNEDTQSFYFKVPYGTRAYLYGVGTPQIDGINSITTSEIPIENTGAYDFSTQFGGVTSEPRMPILLDKDGIPTKPAFLDNNNQAQISTVKYTTSTPEGDRIKKIKESISLPPDATVSITGVEIVGSIPSEPSTDPVNARVIISYSDGSKQGANVPVIVTDDSVATPPKPPHYLSRG